MKTLILVLGTILLILGVVLVSEGAEQGCDSFVVIGFVGVFCFIVSIKIVIFSSLKSL
jgi:hypothetical protein